MRTKCRPANVREALGLGYSALFGDFPRASRFESGPEQVEAADTKLTQTADRKATVPLTRRRRFTTVAFVDSRTPPEILAHATTDAL